MARRSSSPLRPSAAGSASSLSARKKAEGAADDLDRFEAAYPNDLWQSDMMAGPWLPDPDRPGKYRGAWLHAWLDDHSRLLLSGRWSFKSDLPTLELAMREALRRCGVPERVYYDNGGPYRSHHMARIIAVLSNVRPIFTPARRPEGHGKIEVSNCYCRVVFVEEVRASAIHTLDDLHLAFAAWRDLKYNCWVYGEIGETPWDRWRADPARIKVASERVLTEASLFRARRTTDKTGVLKLRGTRYQAGAALARKKVEVRYDPEHMETTEVWHGTTFQERVSPLEKAPHRRPKPAAPEVAPDPEGPLVDFLNQLTSTHKPLPERDEVEAALAEAQVLEDSIVRILEDLMRPEVFDEQAVRVFVGRYGPFEPEVIEEHVQLAVEMGGADPHIQAVLQSVREALGGAAW
jgi:putative transposase